MDGIWEMCYNGYCTFLEKYQEVNHEKDCKKNLVLGFGLCHGFDTVFSLCTIVCASYFCR